jgi:hypothetical protein
VKALDLLCAITGIASYSPEADWGASAKRLLGVILIGLTRKPAKLPAV